MYTNCFGARHCIISYTIVLCEGDFYNPQFTGEEIKTVVNFSAQDVNQRKGKI